MSIANFERSSVSGIIPVAAITDGPIRDKNKHQEGPDDNPYFDRSNQNFEEVFAVYKAAARLR